MSDIQYALSFKFVSQYYTLNTVYHRRLKYSSGFLEYSTHEAKNLAFGRCLQERATLPNKLICLFLCLLVGFSYAKHNVAKGWDASIKTCNN